MGLFDTVPKALLDAETSRREAAEAREAKLIERVHVLTDRISTMRRREKFDTTPAPKAPVLGKDQRLSDQQIINEAEANFLARAAADFEREGLDPKAARAEAERLRRESVGTISQPAE